jgi:hypothetical protein
MKKLSSSAGILAAAASLSLGVIAPAQAAPSCATSGFGGTSAYFLSNLLALGSTGCSIGDKTYSDFSFTGLTEPGALFGFTKSGADHTFSGSSLNFTGSSFEYSYKVSLFNPPAGQEFFRYNTNAAGSSAGTALAFTKSLNEGNGPSVADQDNPGNIVTLPAGTIAPLAFTSTLTRTGGKIDTITDSLTQKLDGPAAVPGPLPVFGAGAAFAFSRRLRNRIKQFS